MGKYLSVLFALIVLYPGCVFAADDKENRLLIASSPTETVTWIRENQSVFALKVNTSSRIDIQDSSNSILASIPLHYPVNRMFYVEGARKLYIVDDLGKSRHQLSIVDLSARRISSPIELNDGHMVSLGVSPDNKTVYCNVGGDGMYPGYIYSATKTRWYPKISLIDTSSDKVINVYDHFVAALPGGKKCRGYYKEDVVYYGNDGKILLESRSTSMYKEKVNRHNFVVYSGKSNTPDRIVDTPLEYGPAALSADVRFVFATVTQKGDKEVKLDIIDLSNGTSRMKTLTGHPHAFSRMGSNRQLWMITREAMMDMDETGAFLGHSIPLMRSESSTGDSTSSGAGFYPDGYIGKTLSIGDHYAAAVVTNEHGASKHMLAIIDLENYKVTGIVPTMTAGEKAKLSAANIGISILGAALSGAVQGAAAGVAQGVAGPSGASALQMQSNSTSYYRDQPWFTYSDETLEVSPDNQKVYALDRDGGVVNVIDVTSATLVTRVHVGSVGSIAMSGDKKYLLCGNRIKPAHRISIQTNQLDDATVPEE